jgi:DNA helicase-2/ATP-dependent DNA helicase PcrA
MNYDSIFNFLDEDPKFKQIYEECLAFENNILNKYESVTLRTGRVICQLLIEKIAKTDSELRNQFFGLDENGNEKRIKLFEVIKACHHKHLIDKKTRQMYFTVKGYGDPTSHGKNYGQYDISDCKKVHEIIFNLAKGCFKIFHEDDLRFDFIDNLEYKYNLDDVEPVQFTLKQRNDFVNKIYEDEINKAKFKNYLKLNKIYLNKDSINSSMEEYNEFILDDAKLNMFLDKNSHVTESNLAEFLSYFEPSEKFNILNNLRIMNKQLLDNISPYLNDFPEEFSIEFVLSKINDSNEESREKLEIIKELCDNFLNDDLEVLTTELNNNPIIVEDDHGREISTYKKYDVVKDDYGFRIVEVEKNIFLDEDQEKAVNYPIDGGKPLVINAGPGSGKTRVLIERVKFLIKNGAIPSTILLITFTNEATNELRNRLKYETDLGINVVNEIRISTVHSFCRYLLSEYEKVPYNYLERYGEKGLFFNKYKKDLGFTDYAEIPDYEFSIAIERKYDYYFNFGLYEEDFANHIRTYVDYNQKVDPAFKKFVDEFKELNDGKFPSFNQIEEANKVNRTRLYTTSYYYEKFIKIVESYPKYKNLLEEHKSCDDNYLLEKAYGILCNHKTSFKHVLIDEFQDTDYHLKQIFDKLKENATTFTIVGDSDQSIYGWRGALPHYFEEIIAPENRENIEYVELHTNYRSTSDLVDFNEEFIRQKRNVPKNLRAKKQYKTPVYHLKGDELNEFSNIIYVIKSLISDNVKKLSDIAVLFRSNYRAESFVQALKSENIPYYLKGNKDLLERDEIKIILTLFWYLTPYDRYSLVYRGDDFLNLSAFSNDFFKDYFKFSQKTKDVLDEMQSNFENKVKSIGRKHYHKPNQHVRVLSYSEVFNQDFSIIKGVIDEIDQVNISDLTEEELIELGIDDANDLEFFLRLNDLKYRMFYGNDNEKPTTLDIFNELIHINGYIDELSIRDTLEAKKTENNLATVSRIIKDYESIKNNRRDYVGLFNYLNGILAAYSSYIDESETYDDEIHVMTVHKSKGLEYPVVIIASLNDGEFPREYRNDYPFPTDIKYLEHKPDDLDSEKKIHYQEEMRMIYVAATRAKELLILSTKSDDVQFLDDLKRSSNIKIEKLNTKNTHMIPKIESSKVKSNKNMVPELFVEDILRNYVVCPHLYYICNDVRFAMNVSDDYHVEMVLHNLLNNIHSQKNLTISDINSKIDSILEYHNLSSNKYDYEIISNVENYWKEYGSGYDVFKSNFIVSKELDDCNLYGTIDLIIKDDDGYSIVQFIGSDKRITNIRYYELILHFYASALRENIEFKDKKLNRIILHSLHDNSVIVDVNIKDIYENYGLRELNKISANILNKRFEKNGDCEICEYSKFCKY